MRYNNLGGLGVQLRLSITSLKLEMCLREAMSAV